MRCGIAAGARPVLNAFTEEVARRDLHGVLVTQTGCIGICQYEPVVEITCPGQEKVKMCIRDRRVPFPPGLQGRRAAFCG